jgi:hypothetical protein
MGEMDLIYLVVGVGLGIIVGRLTRSNKPPVVPVVSPPQGVDSQASSPQKADSQAFAPQTEDSQASLPQKTNIEALQPLQEELKQTKLAYEMAKEWSQFKGGFLARTSHELRSPLSSLIGMHQLILSDLCDSPEEAREFIAQANTSALKMVKLLNEVTEVAKTEHGTNRLDICPLQLAQIFSDVYQLTHLQAANRNLQFKVIPPDPDICVSADPRRFRQVLVSLIDTAIARLESGSIQVSAACASESKQAHIWIDIDSPTPLFNEPVDLLSRTPEEETQPQETSEIPSGLSFLMVQILVDVMKGRLEVLPASDETTASDATGENLTRIQCSMPLGTPDSVEQASA